MYLTGRMTQAQVLPSLKQTSKNKPSLTGEERGDSDYGLLLLLLLLTGLCYVILHVFTLPVASRGRYVSYLHFIDEELTHRDVK